MFGAATRRSYETRTTHCDGTAAKVRHERTTSRQYPAVWMTGTLLVYRPRALLGANQFGLFESNTRHPVP